MRVSKHTRCASTIHGLLKRVGVGLLTLRRELLFAEEAVSTSNLERSDVSLADFNAPGGSVSADLIHDTTELVAEDVALGKLDDCAVEEMQI
jgi:hypothetical protein